jgi:hypothetical protein
LNIAVMRLVERARFGPRMTLEDALKEQEPARMVKLLRYHLGWSPGKITRELNCRNISNRGMPWCENDVERLVRGFMTGS